MGNQKRLNLFPLLVPVLYNAQVFATPDEYPTLQLPPSKISERETGYLFKGKPIPTIDWMSPDTTNFTWGLAGVDNFENLMFSTYLFITLGSLVAFLFLLRTYVYIANHQRLSITVGSSWTTSAAHFYSLPGPRWFSSLRRHLILAPLHKLRHNSPFILNVSSIKLHLGTLPSRLNFLLLFLYVLSNVLYCTLLLPWNGALGPEGKLKQPTKAALVAEFRGRTGVMAVVNMVPLFICMARNNFVGHAVEVGFDTWNLFHRWIGRIVALESLAHMFAWIINKVDQAGWKGVNEGFRISPFNQVGLLAEVALILIIFLSASPARHANYEFFLSMHQLLVLLFVVGVWWHLYIDSLPQMHYCNIAISVWIGDRVLRIFRILRNNVLWGRTGIAFNLAEVKPLEGAEAMRLSVELARPFEYKPGSHAYIYVPRIGWWQSHPFSIAWSSMPESTQSIELTQMEGVRETQQSARIPIASLRREDQSPITAGFSSPYESRRHQPRVAPPRSSSLRSAKIENPDDHSENHMHRGLRTPPPKSPRALPIQHRDLVTSNASQKTTVHFIISKHSGFTKSLYDAIARSEDAEKFGDTPILHVVGLVEGPYGGYQSFGSYGTVLLVAGGVGITHCLGHVRHLVHGYNQAIMATQKVKLVWVIRNQDNIGWVSDWLEEILRIPQCRRILGIDIYITRPSTAGGNEWSGRGGIVNVYVGRPEFETVIGKVVRKRVGAMAVTVCGGGPISDSVRAATIKFVDKASIDFSEESFTW